MKTLFCKFSALLTTLTLSTLCCFEAHASPADLTSLPSACVGSNYNCNLSGQWTLTGPIPWGRVFTTATVLTNGMVLLTGGVTNANSWGANSVYSQALLYNPSSRTWRETAPMASPRMRHTATLLNDGRVLVAGGWNLSGLDLDSAEIYDPESETWTPVAPMSEGREGGVATMLPNGKVMICGGDDVTRDHAPYALYSFTNPRTELFDPATGTWSRAADIANTNNNLAMISALPNGKVFVAGLYPEPSSEVYDPISDSWTIGPSPQCGANCATLMESGRVLITGGSDMIDFAFDSPPPPNWSPDLTNPANYKSTRQGIYDPTNQSIGWSTPNLVGRYFHCAGLLPDGEVLVVGGQTPAQYFADAGDSLTSAEAYDERTGTWRLMSRMNYPRRNATMVTLKDGSLLIVGGDGTYAETFKQFGTGTPPFTYSLASGELPYGLTLQTNGMISGMPVIPQTNICTFTIVDSTGSSESVDCAIAVQENPAAGSESIPPSVSITSPANKSLFVAAPILLNGRASDNGSGTEKSQLAGVLFSVNDGPRRFAKPSAVHQWAAKAQLQAGWNTIVAQAFDKAGNSSTVSSNIYFQGDTSAVAGSYNGLFYETDGVQPRLSFRSAGALLGMQVKIYGQYTGKLFCAGSTYPVSGEFDIKTGNSQITVARANGDLTVDMHMDWTGKQRQVTGTVSCAAEGWSSPISADLNGFTAKNKYKGTRQFTMALQHASGVSDATALGGYSCASVSINSTGDLKMLGALADATPLTQGAKLSKTGRWPIFADLNNHQTVLLGWVDISSGTPSGQVACINALTATPKIVSQSASDVTLLDAFGSVYVPTSPAIQVPQGKLDVAGSASLNAAVLPNNMITRLPGVTNILSGNIAKGTGLMTVKFQAPGQTNVSKATIGVVLQNRNAAYGAFVNKAGGNPAAIYLH